ncbi:hypothetical protein [Streptomyces sp. NPDC052701]|uniref:hypothetical protein n=1 Tax=Streptomyces sp. NPDC052701 TaxID=3155533 RepID=UPI003413460C
MKEEVEQGLTGLLEMIRDSKTPPEERAAYSRILGRLTDTLKTAQDPGTPPGERATYTKIVEGTTETLRTIQDPRTPDGQRAACTRIAAGTAEALGALQDPGTPPEQRAVSARIVAGITGGFGLLTNPEAPKGLLAFNAETDEKDVRTLNHLHRSQAPKEDFQQFARAREEISLGKQISSRPGTPQKLREEIRRTVAQLSSTLVKTYSPSTSQEDRDKGKETGSRLFEDLRKQNKTPSDKPLLEIVNRPSSSTVKPGEIQSFVIRITNHGRAEATGLTVEEGSAATPGGSGGGVIRPVLDAELHGETGHSDDCGITAGATVVNCPAEGEARLAPGKTVRIVIRAVVKASQVPYGEKEDVTRAKFDQGTQQGSARFTVVEPPKLSRKDLEDELYATRTCAEHFHSSGVSGEALAVFTKVMGRELARGTPPAHASSEGYRAALTAVRPEDAVSLAEIPLFDVSLRDAAKAFTSAGNCGDFVNKALSLK